MMITIYKQLSAADKKRVTQEYGKGTMNALADRAGLPRVEDNAQSSSSASFSKSAENKQMSSKR